MEYMFKLRRQEKRGGNRVTLKVTRSPLLQMPMSTRRLAVLS